jgi:alkylation response protein AidB-like acyl-CoA dehydrogenase
MYTMGTLLRHGRPEQKARWLPQIASGALRLQAFGVTEPTSGTDTLSLRTTAVREGNDHYVINGQKIWTSRAEHSDLLLLLARTTPREQVKKRTDGLSVFLVDMRLAQGAGITINPIRTMMNHATTELFIDDLRVPADNLIGEEGQGFRYILSGMNAERILIAAECVGDAKWFIRKATAYAKERVVFGRPIGQNQGVQFPIARAYAQMRAAELMVREAASRYESGLDCGEQANMAKLLAADASWAAADMCVQTHGGFGFAEEFDIERKFRETRLYQTAPISTNLILSYLAEHVLVCQGRIDAVAARNPVGWAKRREALRAHASQPVLSYRHDAISTRQHQGRYVLLYRNACRSLKRPPDAPQRSLAAHLSSRSGACTVRNHRDLHPAGSSACDLVAAARRCRLSTPVESDQERFHARSRG